MGIQGLTKFIKDKFPSVTKDIHVKELRYKKIAVDTSLYLYKFKCVSGDQWLSLFINFISCLRKFDVHPIFIIDTSAPLEKIEEQQKRRLEVKKRVEKVEEIRGHIKQYELDGVITPELTDFYNQKKKKTNDKLDKLGIQSTFDIETVKLEIDKMDKSNISITIEDKEKLKELFEIMGVQFLPAIGEGEQTCAYLNHWGHVDAVMTEDSDAIAYGCKIFLSKFNTSLGTCCIIETDHLLTKLNISREQLVDFCIMLQCDYNKRIPKIGPVSSFKLISKHKSLENIEQETSHDTDCLKYQRCREIFKCIPDSGQFEINYNSPPNFDRLEEFIELNGLNVPTERVRKNCGFISI